MKILGRRRVVGCVECFEILFLSMNDGFLELAGMHGMSEESCSNFFSKIPDALDASTPAYRNQQVTSVRFRLGATGAIDSSPRRPFTSGKPLKTLGRRRVVGFVECLRQMFSMLKVIEKYLVPA
jgi:hypothetical protein